MTALQLRTELFREMSPLLDDESAMTKVLYYIRTLFPAEGVASDTEATDWSSRFVGAWKDTRSADEIVADIRAARTENSREVDL